MNGLNLLISELYLISRDPNLPRTLVGGKHYSFKSFIVDIVLS